MQLLHSLDNLPADLRQGAVSIGNFDGVHRGHAKLVERLLAKAREVGGPAIVFTFDPHPVRLLRPDRVPPPLTWTDRKAQLLDELGVTAIIAYPTDLDLLQLPPEGFFDKIIRQQLAARAMVEGPNFYFGSGRTGNIDTLTKLCQQASISLEVVQPTLIGGQIVSSSRVREAIAAGDVDLARQLLTRPYRVRGMVTHGAGRGAKIGFPTANIEAIDTLLPAQGVYAGQALTPGGNWPAALNIGPNPTFGEHAQKVEVHLIDFAGSLYGQPLEVDFFARLRSIQPFESVAALKSQLARDIAAARQIAAAEPAEDEDAD
ncbi:MAG TPA: bifunctional riboflavin kinase/FAD synthetase [Pirellulaceae bacterium]|nr:bifunctional riboflavin kinase/FAD synthetase [Pirellulaceae bacterium]